MWQISANAPSPPWGVQVDMTIPANAEGQSTAPWDRLHFSPLVAVPPSVLARCISRCTQLLHFLPEPLPFCRYAWFTSGMNRDGNHNYQITSFHPSLVRLVQDTASYAQGKIERKALLTEVKELMFDVVHFFFSSF
jgi:hypothetical protein